MEGPKENKRKEPDTVDMGEEGEGEEETRMKKIKVVGPGMETWSYTPIDFFSKIPREVQMVILTNYGISYYDIARLCAVARMSKKTDATQFFLEVCESPWFWKQKLRRDFPTMSARMEKREGPIQDREWRHKYKIEFDAARTMLFSNVEDGELVQVKRVLSLGVDPNKVDDMMNGNMLAVAAESGYTEIVRALIRAGIQLERSVTLEDNPKSNWTALHFAANGLRLETAQVLVDAGADVNARDDRGRTPLMNLVSDFRFRRTDEESTDKNRIVEAIALMLILNGALVDATDNSEDTALIIASRVHNATLNLVSILVDGGANVNHQGKFDKTALMLAAANNRLEWVNLLLDLDADPNLQDFAGKTALRSVVGRHDRSSRITLLRAMGRKRDMTDMVRMLLEGGADPNVNSETKTTVLGEAAATGDAAMVRILLEAGAEVNAKDPFGDTALMIAAQLVDSQEAEAVALELIDHGADPLLENNLGRTAAMLAQEADNQGVLDVIDDADLPSTQPYTPESSPRGYRKRGKRGKRGKKKYRSGERTMRPF
jgi:ankyrin repeat protein